MTDESARPFLPPQRLYLDANATTPTCAPARQAALRAMETLYGNPSSSHSEGVRARHVLDSARAAARNAIGAGQGQVVFVSGATEAIHTAVFSALLHLRRQRDAGHAIAHRLVVGATEHKAVLSSVRHWNAVLELHLQVCELPVARDGRHDLVTLRHWIDDTALLCTMAANNETGVITDLAGMEALLRAQASQALWLVDGVQALGKLPLALANSRIDYAAFSGHKLYAPKGVGLLYVAARAPYSALIVGGGQEGELRAGTENLPGIAALGAVCEALVAGDGFASHASLLAHRAALVQALQQAFAGLVFNAPLAICLPTTLNFSVPGASSRQLMNLFDAAGLQVSAGSACSAGQASSSHVLSAMGVPAWAAESAIRLSFGALDTADTINAACQAIARCGKIWSRNPAASAPATTHWIATAKSPQPSIDLPWEALDAFLADHPQAMLVDVRDTLEVAAGGLWQHGERTAQHVPLAQWDQWCAQHQGGLPEPVVVLCRTGKRSAQAAQHLQATAPGLVRHIPGGLALRELAGA